jgi:predicted phosphodiesterase
MRIQIASDLHLEYLEQKFPAYRGVEQTDADVLILAGDVASGTRVFDLFADWPCPIVFVPGNHEFYQARVDDVLKEFELRAVMYPGIKVLAPGTVQIADVRFIGCTLWTDFNVFGSDMRTQAMQECDEKIIDHQVITGRDGALLSPGAARQLHLEQRAWLRNILREPFSGKTVVVTHHGPHPNSMDPRFADQLTSAGFVSNLAEELKTADVFIHGHVHRPSDYAIGNARVIANPLGYCRGIKNATVTNELTPENELFNPRMVIEV